MDAAFSAVELGNLSKYPFLRFGDDCVGSVFCISKCNAGNTMDLACNFAQLSILPTGGSFLE